MLLSTVSLLGWVTARLAVTQLSCETCQRKNMIQHLFNRTVNVNMHMRHSESF